MRRPRELYERAVELTHGYYVDPVALADAALARDPGFAAAHCLKAALAVMSAERGPLPMLEASVAAVEALGTRANERERAHVAAARAWLDGDFERSARLYGDIALDYPLDLLALQTAHLGDFYLGESALLRDRVTHVLRAWSPAVPGYGYVLGMYAFGLEETANYAAAENAGRRALDLNARDPWATHAVAHVLEMQGRIAEGIEFLAGTASDWAPGNGLAFHNWWHLALYHLDLGDHARALELYDARIHPGTTAVALELIDASALLWRLHLAGVDTGQRWQALARDWAATAEGGFYAFNDVHALMAFIATGESAATNRIFKTLSHRAQQNDPNGRMSRDVGLPLARALVAFGRGDYAAALDGVLGMRTRAQRFGGSHAQRDVIHLTALESALRAGDGLRSAALAAERTAFKPTSPWNWRLAQRAADLAGDVLRGAECHAQFQRRHLAQRRNAAA
jgi:tetratricopeptide (TPR) repeat protein